jgi:hypothetical protein
MFSTKKSMNAYSTVQNSVQGGADFEKRWFESVVMVLNQVQNNLLDPVLTHVRLIEVRDGLQWIQENLNERLPSQQRTMLKSIYSLNIQIINGALETKNTEYLPMVVASIKTVLQPYERRTVVDNIGLEMAAA